MIEIALMIFAAIIIDGGIMLVDAELSQHKENPNRDHQYWWEN